MPKMVSTGTLSTPAAYRKKLEKLRGVDLTSNEINVAEYRSPDAPNMMPDEDGAPRKRPGTHTVASYDGAIHGVYFLQLNATRHKLVHAGTKLYEGNTVLYSGMADSESNAYQLGGKLWILDGTTYLYYDGETVAAVQSIATVPLITIAKAPNGKDGATSYKPINLLTGRRTERYAGTAEDTDYYLSYNGLTEEEVTVKKLTADGEWQTLTLTTDYTVDRTLGKVHFTTAPGVSPASGEDNVEITYSVADKAEKINKMRFGVLYGVNGALDRLFVAGNDSEPNTDRWCEWNNPAYFGDVYYSVIGTPASPIIGYNILGSKLVTHKQGEENSLNAWVRQGSLEADGDAVFAFVGNIQGDGAVARRTCLGMKEPMFLTKRGVYALTPNDVTGERYSQCRSEYINGALTKADNMESACAIAWGRFYVLAVDSRMYLLDTEQKSVSKQSPYATHQYEAYYFTGLAASCLWVEDEKLCFGTNTGKLIEFYQSPTSQQYTDDGVSYDSWWITPLLNLDTWGNLKTVIGMWVVPQPYSRSKAEILYATDKDFYKPAKDYTLDMFGFDDVDFARWTFSTTSRASVVPVRKKAKKVKYIAVKVKSLENQPFGLYAIEIEYRKGGKVKK